MADVWDTPEDLVLTWVDDELVLTAGDAPVDVELQLEITAGEASAALAPIELSLVANEAESVLPTLPELGAPVGAPLTVHGWARVFDEVGRDRGVRGVPDRLLIADRPGESWDPDELEQLLPVEVVVDAGTRVATADPELFAGEVSP